MRELSDIHRSLAQCPALILNADYRPLSYFPLSVWSWQDAVKAIFRDSVVVVSEYERVVRSPSRDLKLPSVLALRDYVSTDRTPAFTRFNIFLRDGFQCQYCQGYFKPHELTFDHVIPRSLGGRTSWENIVASCQPCNTRKGNRIPDVSGMIPKQIPYRPTIGELQQSGRRYPPNYLHESWRDFLYWDSELEEA